MNNTTTQNFEKEKLARKLSSGRIDIILMAMLTIINIIFTFTDAQTYFFFSAFVPYRMAFYGAYLTGKLPEEYYTDWGDASFFGNGFLIAMLVMAAIIITFYVLCFFLSKKKNAWLIFATVLFSIDTLALVGYAISYSVIAECIIDILLHAYVLYGIISAIIAAGKLKDLPDEEIVVEDASSATADVFPSESTVADENTEDKSEE